LPHAWLGGREAIQDRMGNGYTLLRLGGSKEDLSGFQKEMNLRKAPFELLDIPDAAARDLYGHDLILLRPDLHVAWRGQRAPAEPRELAALATGHLTRTATL
jgi:hypothetical protein